MSRKPKAASGPWKRGGMRSFMGFYEFQWLERGGIMRRDSTGVNYLKQRIEGGAKGKG